MKKILVPVDFSGHTAITCRYALEYAKIYTGEIRLFHTYFDQILLPDTSLPDTLDLGAIYNEALVIEIARQAELQMKELQEKLEDIVSSEAIKDVTISAVVNGGEIEHELKGICDEFHPDLVVTGTTGKGKTHKVWGKVASFIIDHAKVPVITVPEINTYLGYSSIMFTADLSECNGAILKKLLKNFSPFSTHIHVVHFVINTAQTDAWVKMKALQMNFTDEEAEGRLNFEIVEVTDDNQSTIDGFIAQNNISMIAFQPHKRSFLYMWFTKKITKKNLFATNIPLLSVPG